MTPARIETVEHAMTRLNVFTGLPFDEFCAAFEAAAPAYDPQPFQRIADDGGTWERVEQTMADFASHDLVIYARLDTRSAMAPSGIGVKAIEYLLGNHVIATSMMWHDSNAMLYAPLRVLVFSDDSGDAVFAIDRPATVFAGLGNDQISRTGVLLDAKVAGLLRSIGVDADAALGQPPVA